VVYPLTLLKNVERVAIRTTNSMKICRVRNDGACILHFDARCRWVINLTFRSF